MTDDRRIMLSIFIEKKFSGGNYHSLASHLHYHQTMPFLLKYLETADVIGKRSYNAFIKEHSQELCMDKMQNEKKAIICDFLTANGIGFEKKERKKTVENQKSIVSIDEQKQAKLNTFTSWLQAQFDYSSNTLGLYVRSVKGFFSYYDRFTEANARDYINFRERQGSKPATVDAIRTSLVIYGKSVGLIVNIKRRKVAKNLDTENVPNEKDYNRLLDYLHENSMINYFRIKILGTTGARHSELRRMKWEDVASGEVVLKGKGSKLRRFFFTKELQSEVKEYMKQSGETGFIEKNDATGGLRSDRCLNQNLKEWAKRLGIDTSKMHCHAFRHFFAKMYLKGNKDVVQLAELLGHERIDTTRIYLQKTKNEQQREFNRIVSW